MATPSNKRRIITLEEKKKIIEASAKANPKKSLKDLSEEFGMPRSTIKTILDNKDSILGAIEEGSKAKRSHLLPTKHEDLEEAVLRWFKAARNENVPISGPLLTVSLINISW
jgi:hypothetical protein